MKKNANCMCYLLCLSSLCLLTILHADIIDYRDDALDIPVNEREQTIFFKSGVNIEQLNQNLIDVFPEIINVYQSHGVDNPVITSGNDGKHRKGSAHYSNLAVDLRTNNISHKKSSAIANALQKALGSEFKVILETYDQRANNHIHLEYIANHNLQFISFDKIN